MLRVSPTQGSVPSMQQTPRALSLDLLFPHGHVFPQRDWWVLRVRPGSGSGQAKQTSRQAARERFLVTLASTRESPECFTSNEGRCNAVETAPKQLASHCMLLDSYLEPETNTCPMDDKRSSCQHHCSEKARAGLLL